MSIQNSIERLPDELLISIVSRLPLKDAARTSILAHKWRCFWVFSPFLDFDGSHVISKFLKDSKSIELLNSERTNFENLVDRVLNLHCSTTIEEFRLSFNLNSTSSNYITRWFEFAFTKRVKKLEMDLVGGYTGISQTSYQFPNICDPIERLCIFPISHRSSCESLVILRLNRVRITGEALEFFISNCPLLEELFVEISMALRSLRISSPSTRLRRLVIRECPYLRILEICSPNVLSHLELHNILLLRTLEICSPNLLSFTLSGIIGKEVYMALKNVSSLTNLSIEEDVPATVAYNLLHIPGCLSRLETLVIHVYNLDLFQVHPQPKFPNLLKLKKLVLNTKYGCESVFSFAFLIDAAPMLREIVLQVDFPSNFVTTRFIRRLINSAEGQRHESLEMIEIVGFAGSNTEFELAQYMIAHAVSLKKVTIDRRRPYPLQTEARVFSERIRRLQANLFEGVELIVL